MWYGLGRPLSEYWVVVWFRTSVVRVLGCGMVYGSVVRVLGCGMVYGCQSIGLWYGLGRPFVEYWVVV